MNHMDLAGLPDEVLLGKVEALAETERFTMADFLLHLGELDQRDACQRKGYSSLFAYLTRHLGFSECDAMRRVRAARAARRFPSILHMIARGELHLVGVSLLEPYLTSENHRRLAGRARGKSQREIERMAAELAPAAAVPKDRIRALPEPAKTLQAVRAGVDAQLLAVMEMEPAAQARPGFESAGSLRLFTFAAGEQVHGWFLQARDLLRHRFPGGRMEEIIGEALRRLVEEELPGEARKKTGRVASDSRRIPAWARAKVWQRDGGRCSYAGPTGLRCAETGWLEYDHKTPWALGGRSDDPENIRLLCRAHNQVEARRHFGRGPWDR